MTPIYKSPLCSCILCRKECSVKGINSHFLISHDSVHRAAHKERRAKQSTSGKPNKLAVDKQKRIQQYNTNPNLCNVCNNDIPYHLRNTPTCSKSCAAVNGNKKRNINGYVVSIDHKTKTSNTAKANGPRGKKITPIRLCVICNTWFETRYAKTCSAKCLNELHKSNAHVNNLGKMGQRSGKHSTVMDSFGTIVRLESSYESLLANILNTLSINWIRPGPLHYVDNLMKKHRYFPDFYLVDYDIYLDPKNNYLIVKDADKIKNVSIQNKVNIVIVSKDNLTQDFIRDLVG